MNYNRITILGCLFFLPFLGYVHLFDWDEINFAEAAREMIVTGDYLKVQIDYEPFYEKPPLFIWLQVISMKLFGVNEFSARFPNAVCGVLTLCIIYTLGKNLREKNLGLIWALIYFGSLLPHFYFKSGIIDPWFNLFIFLSIYFIFKGENFDTIHGYEKDSVTEHIKVNRKKYMYSLISGFFAGLSLLVKGPAGVFIIVLTVSAYHIYTLVKNIFSVVQIRFHTFSSILQHLHFSYNNIQKRFINVCIFFLGAVLISSVWYLTEWYFHGPDFINEFIMYQFRLFSTEDSGHGGPFYYHFVVLLIGCFPASVFLFSGWKHDKFYESNLINFSLLMKILLLVVLVLFSIVKTKIVHYSSLAYFPVTFVAAYSVFAILKGLTGLSDLTKSVFIITGIILLSLFSGIAIFLIKPELIIDNIKDPFALACMRDPLPTSNLLFTPAIIFLSGLLLCGILMWLKKKMQFLISIWFIVPVCLILFQVTILPFIEYKIQGSVILFYKEIGKKEQCAEPKGFKSYAHLFYTRKKNTHCQTEYFICKNIHAEKYKNFAEFELLYTKGGFSYFRRKKKQE